MRLLLEKVTIPDPAFERLSDHIADKLSVDLNYEFRKDELYGVMGVCNKATGKDGKTLASVTRKYHLIEKKGSAGGKRFRYFVRQETAETDA